MDLLLAASLLRTEGPCRSIVGAVPDGDGDRLLEALLLFRRVLLCPAADEVWPRRWLFPPSDGFVRRVLSAPASLFLSALCLFGRKHESSLFKALKVALVLEGCWVRLRASGAFGCWCCSFSRVLVRCASSRF